MSDMIEKLQNVLDETLFSGLAAGRSAEAFSVAWTATSTLFSIFNSL